MSKKLKNNKSAESKRHVANILIIMGTMLAVASLIISAERNMQMREELSEARKQLHKAQAELNLLRNLSDGQNDVNL